MTCSIYEDRDNNVEMVAFDEGDLTLAFEYAFGTSIPSAVVAQAFLGKTTLENNDRRILGEELLPELTFDEWAARVEDALSGLKV